MFNKKDMTISLLVAEKEMKEKEVMFREEIDALTKGKNKIINSMKSNSNIKGILKIRNSQFSFGESTPHFSNGIQLFTGDEVSFRDGKIGVVVKSNCKFMVYTNKEVADIVDEEYMKQLNIVFAKFEGYVLGDNLIITKHFNELKHGEEIAKGRKGAEGFIVDLNG